MVSRTTQKLAPALALVLGGLAFHAGAAEPLGGERLDGPREACENWHRRALELRAANRYLAARDALAYCSLRVCTARQRATCEHASRVLEDETPQLLVRVHDVSGDELERARVFVDGQFTPAGRAFELDPGSHLVRAEEDAHVGRLKRVRMAPGERLVLPLELSKPRKIADERITLLGDRLQSLRDERWPMPEAAWTMTGIGIASLASAIILDAYAAEGMEGMRSCAPDCEEAMVEAVEREIQLSRIAGGLSIVSLATAAWLALAESPADAFAPRSSGAPRLRVFGGVGGLRVTLTTSFDETLLFRGFNPLGRPPERIPPPPLPTEVLCPWGCAPVPARVPFDF
jgi:hypothetical protein